MRILVTGGNGQLGHCIRLAAAHSAHEYIFKDVDDLDITDPEAVALDVKVNRYDVIVNCAAYTNVERAEDQADIALRINAEAARYLAEAARDNGVQLIHVSTDYVFGGNQNNTPCSEDQPANPTGVYGSTKLKGEEAITASGCHYVILRTAWLYSEFGNNFVKTMLQLTATKPQLKVVFDQTGTPTYARDLAQAITDLIETRRYEGHDGIYHYSNEGVCSWYDFTRMIAEYAGHDACDVQPCHSSEFPSKVVRPSYSVLDKSKFKATFGLKVPYWTDSLKLCVKNLKEA
jgi:dTDP-4-dehydrorhamnose reductase